MSSRCCSSPSDELCVSLHLVAVSPRLRPHTVRSCWLSMPGACAERGAPAGFGTETPAKAPLSKRARRQRAMKELARYIACASRKHNTSCGEVDTAKCTSHDDAGCWLHVGSDTWELSPVAHLQSRMPAASTILLFNRWTFQWGMPWRSPKGKCIERRTGAVLWIEVNCLPCPAQWVLHKASQHSRTARSPSMRLLQLLRRCAAVAVVVVLRSVSLSSSLFCTGTSRVSPGFTSR